MCQIILPSDASDIHPDQPDRPTALQVHVSRVAVSNCRLGAKTTLDDLKEAVQVHDKARLFQIRAKHKYSIAAYVHM